MSGDSAHGMFANYDMARWVLLVVMIGKELCLRRYWCSNGGSGVLSKASIERRSFEPLWSYYFEKNGYVGSGGSGILYSSIKYWAHWGLINAGVVSHSNIGNIQRLITTNFEVLSQQLPKLRSLHWIINRESRCKLGGFVSGPSTYTHSI